MELELKNRILEVAKEAALKAGKYVLNEKKKSLNIEQKEDDSWATHADKEAENIIRDLIIKNFPSHDIYGEEFGHISTGSDYVWYVDPIDGTHNYMKGVPLYGVSIGVYYKNEGVVGVIYLPEFDDFYEATRNGGAFLNGEKIHLDNHVDEKPNVSFELSGSEEFKEMVIEKYMKNILLNFSFRKFGSSVYDFVQVCSGNLSSFIGFNLKPYDVAAGIIILEECGGIIKSIDENSEHLLFESNIICTNNKKTQRLLLEGLKK